jgi:eukaryotic-like serine/threonine-protein kinase
MTSDRWRQVDALYHAALERDAAERLAFLASACGGDQALRHEVESLLAESNAGWSVFEGPAMGLAAQLVSDVGNTSMVGRLLGAYELRGPLGAGGMGEVYRAFDTRLGREVAIKILPRAFKEDPERVTRFEREAKVLASLNHPYIAAIYGLEDLDGVPALVMELVEGDDLSALLARGPIPVDDALTYARQIAEALEVAHERGIVHRDLKPANVKVRRDRTVKVLDFGLAKDLLPASKDVGMLTALSPHGATMGTPPYMSPEQVRGEAVGREADIWSFGVVLYEMLTGLSPFARQTIAETMASVLGSAPDYSRLPSETPPNVLRLIRRCLEKDLKRRLKHIGDARIEIDEPLGGPPAEAAAPATRGAKSSRALVTVAVAVICIALASVLALALLRRTAVERVEYSARRLTFDDGLTTDPAISPDGKLIAFASDRSGEDHLDVYVQQAAGGPPLRLTFAEGDDHEPAFSPDGSTIAFRSEREGGELYVMPALGGDARLLVRDGHDARFSPDGRHVAYTTAKSGTDAVAVTGRCYVIPTDGGEPRLITPNFRGAESPVWIDDRTVLFHGLAAGENDVKWWTTDIENPHPKVSPLLKPTVRDVALNHASGQLVFVSGAFADFGSLWTLSLDQGTAAAREGPRRLMLGMGDRVRVAIANNGTIAVARTSVSVNIWSLPIGQNAEPTQLTFDAANKFWPDVSIDDRYITYASARSGNMDVYLRDLVAGRETLLATSPKDESHPIFTTHGTRIAYVQHFTPAGPGAIRGEANVFSHTLTGGSPQLVVHATLGRFDQLSDDGRYVVWHTGADPFLHLLEVATNTQHVILRTEPPRSIYQPRISRDGEWITFLVKADEADSRIYGARFRGIQPIPSSEWIPLTEGVAGDDKPRLSADRRRLFFTSEADGHRCIWVRDLEPATLRPIRAPTALHHFHSARRSLSRVLLNQQDTGLGSDRIVFNMAETTGNVWLLQPQPAGE